VYLTNHHISTKNYDKYVFDTQLAYLDMLHKNSPDLVWYICLTERLVTSSPFIIRDTSDFSITDLADINIKLDNNDMSFVKTILININNESIVPKTKTDLLTEQQERVDKRVNEFLRFTNGLFDEFIIKKFFDGFRFTFTLNDDDRKFNRCLLIKLYEKRFVEFDSKLSHNLMRGAVRAGCLWLVKFLVDGGCPTRNLPVYNTSKTTSLHFVTGRPIVDIDAMQLKDILAQDIGIVENNTFLLKQRTKRNMMREYFIKHNLIDSIFL